MAIYNHLGRHILQCWYNVEITQPDEEGPKYVRFHSQIHKNMPTQLTHCYSNEFTDEQILNDHSVMTKFIEHFGADSFTK